MPLNQSQIDQATAMRDIVNANTNPLCVARDNVDTILQHHDLIDEATGTALLLRCKANALTAAQAIVEALS